MKPVDVAILLTSSGEKGRKNGELPSCIFFKIPENFAAG
jgi:hypothetical protein